MTENEEGTGSPGLNTNRCKNGHTTSDEQPFCAQCGSRVRSVASATTASSRSLTLSGWSRRSLVTLASTALLLVAAVLVATAIAHRGVVPSGQAAPQVTTPVAGVKSDPVGLDDARFTDPPTQCQQRSPEWLPPFQTMFMCAQPSGKLSDPRIPTLLSLTCPELSPVALRGEPVEVLRGGLWEEIDPNASSVVTITTHPKTGPVSEKGDVFASEVVTFGSPSRASDAPSVLLSVVTRDDANPDKVGWFTLPCGPGPARKISPGRFERELEEAARIVGDPADSDPSAVADLNEVEAQEYEAVLASCDVDPGTLAKAGDDGYGLTEFSYTSGGQELTAYASGEYHSGVAVETCGRPGHGIDVPAIHAAVRQEAEAGWGITVVGMMCTPPGERPLEEMTGEDGRMGCTVWNDEGSPSYASVQVDDLPNFTVTLAE